MVAITPGTAILWAHLHLSGYTYNDDGSRNLGHVAKALGSDLILTSVLGVIILGLGLLAVLLARRKGTLTATRLLLFACGLGSAIGLMAAGLLTLIPENRSSGLKLLALTSSVTAAAFLMAMLLCLQFIVVSATPFRATPAGARSSSTLIRLIDRSVLFVAAAATIIAVAWIAQLWLFAIQHPCDCG